MYAHLKSDDAAAIQRALTFYRGVHATAFVLEAERRLGVLRSDG